MIVLEIKEELYIIPLPSQTIPRLKRDEVHLLFIECAIKTQNEKVDVKSNIKSGTVNAAHKILKVRNSCEGGVKL